MSTVVNIQELNARIEQQSAFVDLLTLEMSKVIVGQKHLVESLLIGLLSDGHILLEGVPGLAKPWPSIRWPMLWMPSSAVSSSPPTSCRPT